MRISRKKKKLAKKALLNWILNNSEYVYSDDEVGEEQCYDYCCTSGTDEELLRKYIVNMK